MPQEIDKTMQLTDTLRDTIEESSCSPVEAMSACMCVIVELFEATVIPGDQDPAEQLAAIARSAMRKQLEARKKYAQ